MAPSAEQSVVAFTAMVTSASESGVTVISHLAFLPGSSRRTLLTEPPVTVKAWSRTVAKPKPDCRLLAEPQLEGELGAPIVGRGLVVDRGVKGGCVTAVAALVTDSSFPSSSVKDTRTLMVLPASAATTV